MLYFAYGMNTNNKKMGTTAVRLGPAVLPNYAWEMLLFANVYEQYNVRSLGILWQIDEEILALLDQREKFPMFYNRLIADVLHNSQTKQAWVYTMTADNRTRLLGTRPRKAYLDAVTEGYATDSLNINFLNYKPPAHCKNMDL